MTDHKLHKTIGIIGGVGPYAGLDLKKKIFDNTITQGRDQDHLEVYLLSRPADIADRTAFLEGTIQENPAEGIFRTLKKLSLIGAHVMGIPCNTAHSPRIFNQVRQKIAEEHLDCELLNMIEETRSYLLSLYPGVKKVGLLGTQGTYQSGVYSEVFERDQRFSVITPESKEAKQNVHDAIYHPAFGIKAFSNPIRLDSIQLLVEEARKLAAAGAQVIIMGCTEIPLALNEQSFDLLPLIDPTNILARAMIQTAAADCLKA